MSKATAVPIPVPEVDPLPTAAGEWSPEAVRAGMPAQVSPLYPFPPADTLDDRWRLHELFGFGAS